MHVKKPFSRLNESLLNLDPKAACLPGPRAPRQPVRGADDTEGSSKPTRTTTGSKSDNSKTRITARTRNIETIIATSTEDEKEKQAEKILFTKASIS